MGSSGGLVTVDRVRSVRGEGSMLMETFVSCSCARCSHDHPHFTGKKTEAPRSQKLTLADPKECRTSPSPSKRSLPVTPTPNLLQPHPYLCPGPDAMDWGNLCICSAPQTQFSLSVLGGIPLHPFAGWKSLLPCSFHPFTWGPSWHWEVFWNPTWRL